MECAPVWGLSQILLFCVYVHVCMYIILYYLDKNKCIQFHFQIITFYLTFTKLRYTYDSYQLVCDVWKNTT